MQLEHFDLNLLKALNLLLTEGNVTAAARKAHVTQSAMSGMLRRLREQLGDELLVAVGRRMKLTPRAEQLIGPVSEALQLIHSRIMTQPRFDPALSERRFTIQSSEYTTLGLLADVLNEIGEIAPKIAFDIVRPNHTANISLLRGDLDLNLVPVKLSLPDQPKAVVLKDEYVVVACRDHPAIGPVLSEEQFLHLGHLGVRIDDQHLTSAEIWLQTHYGGQRRVEIYTRSYLEASYLLIGTRRIAVMQERLARSLARYMPLLVRPCPVPIPETIHVLQWHRTAEGDLALKWLVDQIVSRAAAHLEAA